MDRCACNAHSLLTTFALSEDAPRWWNPLNSTAIDARISAGGLWAWRAQANDNITWGAGPVNYAASLTSVEGNTVVLAEGNGAVPWTPANGWGFVAGNAQYFITQIVPTNDQSYVMFVQFANNVQINAATLAGTRHASDRSFAIQPQRLAGLITYYNGNFVQSAAVIAGGNLAVVGNQAYRNGVFDGGPIGAWAGASTFQVYVGCVNSAIPSTFVTADIHAILICDDVTAFTGADITAISISPTGSMQNL